MDGWMNGWGWGDLRGIPVTRDRAACASSVVPSRGEDVTGVTGVTKVAVVAAVLVSAGGDEEVWECCGAPVVAGVVERVPV